MEKVTVSIVCDVYNHEPYLRQCLDGFVMQKTDFPFEILIHDDASTDKSADIIGEYASKYPDLFKPIYQSENQYSKGVRTWRDIQLPRAKGEYIAICEGDDYWTDPHKLQKQVDFMELHPNVGLCYTDYNQQYDQGTIVPSMFEKQHQYRPQTYEQHLLKPGYLAPMTWLFRRELQEMLTNSKIYTDGTYAYMLEFMKNSNVAYLPDVTATYRSHKGSASYPVNNLQMFRYMKGVFDTQRCYAESYPCDEELRRKIYMRGYLNLLPVAVMAGNDEFVEEAREYMESQDMDISLIIRELKQGEMRKHSKAYKIGKAILKPFMWMKQ